MPIRNLTDIAAIEATPLAERALPPHAYAAIEAAARRTPEAKALSFFLSADRFDRAHVWTYAEFLADVTRAANAFASFGATPDRPVAFVLPNLPETHFAIWGGETAAAVLALNPMLEAKRLADLLRVARASVLVTLAPALAGGRWADLAAELGSLPDLDVVAFVDMGRYLDPGKAEAARRSASEATVPGVATVNLREVMDGQPAQALVQPPAPGAVSSYFCTGGTTGAPKIAVRTHAAEVFDAWAVAQAVESDGAPRALFCGLPLFHVNAQLVTGLMAWMCGDYVVLGGPEGYRGEGVIARFWEIAAHFRIAMFSGVPTIYAALLNSPVGDHDLSSLTFAICGAAPMPASLIAAFEARTGLKILEGYGLTEAACVSSVNPPAGERRAGSIGLPLPYQRMAAAVLDDAGRFLRFADVDETGVVVIDGPNVFLGYLDPRHDADAWLDIDGRRWLNTGDLGRRDADGYFWLTGRKKELIIRGGHNIDPRIIEDALLSHPDVALAAAVGRPDSYAGETPVAYVQPRPGAALSEADLLAHAARTIPERAATPKEIRILPSLPTTAVGKLFKPALARFEVESVIRAEADRVGAAVASIRADPDSRNGAGTVVEVAGGAERLRQALERYTFPWRLIESGGNGA